MNFSVLMSVYNREKAVYLEQSLNSLMAQTVLPSEIILVCDGCLNESLESVISDFCANHEGLLKLVRLEKNEGLGKALNAGLPHCSYELVARMDTDDVAIENRFEIQLEIMATINPDVCSGTLLEFSNNVEEIISTKELPSNTKDIIKYAKKRNPFNHPAVMFKKSIITDLGGYEDFYLFEDYQLWIKVLNSGGIGYNTNKPLVKMRVGDGMYKRRGGLKYLKSIINIEKYKFSAGFTNKREFVYCVFVKSISSLMPNFIRAFLYKKILR